MDIREKILRFMRASGPILPVKLAKEIGSDILMASAHLAELSARGIVKVSSIKIGGSPLYYLPEQKDRLQSFISNLNEKERIAYDMLMSKKVIREKELEPLLQVVISKIKDFAIPLNVTYNNNKETFWKWYSLTEEEAKEKIQECLNKIQQTESSKLRQTENQEDNINQESERAAQLKVEQQRQEQLRREEELKRKSEEFKRYEQQRQDQLMREKQLKHHEQLRKSELESINIERQKLVEEKRKLEEERKRIEYEKEKIPKPKQEEQKTLQKEQKDPFFAEIEKHFDSKKIKILSYELSKKNKELDLVISVPSSVGDLTYYCKAKNKKKISDSDLSSAFVQGQLKKLPVLFLSKGDLTKKAQEMLNKEFKGISISKI